MPSDPSLLSESWSPLLLELLLVLELLLPPPLSFPPDPFPRFGEKGSDCVRAHSFPQKCTRGPFSPKGEVCPKTKGISGVGT